MVDREVDLEETRAISLVSQALADDFCRVDQVLEDRVVDGSQGAAARAKLLQLPAVAGFLADDSPL